VDDKRNEQGADLGRLCSGLLDHPTANYSQPDEYLDTVLRSSAQLSYSISLRDVHTSCRYIEICMGIGCPKLLITHHQHFLARAAVDGGSSNYPYWDLYWSCIVVTLFYLMKNVLCKKKSTQIVGRLINHQHRSAFGWLLFCALLLGVSWCFMIHYISNAQLIITFAF
jgi:hypothetical protein